MQESELTFLHTNVASRLRCRTVFDILIAMLSLKACVAHSDVGAQSALCMWKCLLRTFIQDKVEMDALRNIYWPVDNVLCCHQRTSTCGD